jgi:hypothetical protein
VLGVAEVPKAAHGGPTAGRSIHRRTTTTRGRTAAARNGTAAAGPVRAAASTAPDSRSVGRTDTPSP